MAHTPTAYERHAAEAQAEALDYLDRAASLFGIAEQSIVNEEALHPAPSPSNQRMLVSYAETMTALDRIRHTFVPATIS